MLRENRRLLELLPCLHEAMTTLSSERRDQTARRAMTSLHMKNRPELVV